MHAFKELHGAWEQKMFLEEALLYKEKYNSMSTDVLAGFFFLCQLDSAKITWKERTSVEIKSL